MTTRRVVGRKGRNSVLKQDDNSWVIELVKAGGRGLHLAVTVATTGEVLVAQGVPANGKTPTNTSITAQVSSSRDEALCGGYDSPGVVLCHAK